MKLRKILTTFLVIVLAAVIAPARATTYYVSGLVVKAYATSATAGTQANMIEVSPALYNGVAHPWCGNRVYVDLGDKELYAAILVAGYSRATVSILYDDAATSKNVAGHQTTQCKLLSIYQ